MTQPKEVTQYPNFHFYNADNMEIMRRYPDKYFDLAIVDPPYGDSCNLKGGSSHSGKNGWSGKISKTDQWNIAPNSDYFNEILRISKNQIVWGANHFISLIPFNSSSWLVWDKGQREFSLADGELAWTSFDKALRIFTYARAKALQEGKIHPTQKPVALYAWLLRNYAKPNDKIIDTHLGSNSIGIAVEKANSMDKMNLSFVGIELDPEYFEAGINRFKQHKRQCVLF